MPFFKRINVDAIDLLEKVLESILNIVIGILKFLIFVFFITIWGIALVGLAYFYCSYI